LARKDFVLNNPQELNNKDITIAVRKGTLGETVAMRDYADATIISLDNFDTAMLEVVQGRADVALADPLTVYEKNQDNMETTIAIYTSISPLPLAIAIRKDNTQLKTDIDESLGRFIAEGKMNELTDRYLKDIKQQFADQNMPFFLF
jgi:ABC-type amino acid transport substrate-binding protein